MKNVIFVGEKAFIKLKEGSGILYGSSFLIGDIKIILSFLLEDNDLVTFDKSLFSLIEKLEATIKKAEIKN